MTSLDWMEEGLCQEVDPDLHYPDRGESAKPAKEVCARCSVIDVCREYALATSEQWGVWGGLSETERKRMRRRGTPRPRPAVKVEQYGDTVLKLADQGMNDTQIGQRLDMSPNSVRWIRRKAEIPAGQQKFGRAAA